MKDDAVYRMPFSKIYPLLVAKVVRKGRTKEEADAVIRWLTPDIRRRSWTRSPKAMPPMARSLKMRPAMNPKRMAVKGSICGVRVEEIQEPLMRDIRILDKLIDELAKGRPMEKILRE